MIKKTTRKRISCTLPSKLYGILLLFCFSYSLAQINLSDGTLFYDSQEAVFHVKISQPTIDQSKSEIYLSHGTTMIGLDRFEDNENPVQRKLEKIAKLAKKDLPKKNITLEKSENNRETIAENKEFLKSSPDIQIIFNQGNQFCTVVIPSQQFQIKDVAHTSSSGFEISVFSRTVDDQLIHFHVSDAISILPNFISGRAPPLFV